MKKILIKLLIITLVFTVACKTEPKEVTEEFIPEKVVEPIKELEVIVKFKSNKDDSFKLMLNNVVVDEFQKKNIHVIEKVIASSESESFTATFGENNISRNFNFHFGSKEIKEIEIESVIFSYGTKKLSIDRSELAEYFSINKYITLDTISNILKTKKVDGKHNPTIILKRKYMKTLSEME